MGDKINSEVHVVSGCFSSYVSFGEIDDQIRSFHWITAFFLRCLGWITEVNTQNCTLYLSSYQFKKWCDSHKVIIIEGDNAETTSHEAAIDRRCCKDYSEKAIAILSKANGNFLETASKYYQLAAQCSVGANTGNYLRTIQQKIDEETQSIEKKTDAAAQAALQRQQEEEQKKRTATQGNVETEPALQPVTVPPAAAVLSESEPASQPVPAPFVATVLCETEPASQNEPAPPAAVVPNENEEARRKRESEELEREGEQQETGHKERMKKTNEVLIQTQRLTEALEADVQKRQDLLRQADEKEAAQHQAQQERERKEGDAKAIAAVNGSITTVASKTTFYHARSLPDVIYLLFAEFIWIPPLDKTTKKLYANKAEKIRSIREPHYKKYLMKVMALYEEHKSISFIYYLHKPERRWGDSLFYGPKHDKRFLELERITTPAEMEEKAKIILKWMKESNRIFYCWQKPEVTKVMLQLGADPNKKLEKTNFSESSGLEWDKNPNKMITTPLHCAVYAGRFDVYMLLRNNGADPKIKTPGPHGLTALELARAELSDHIGFSRLTILTGAQERKYFPFYDGREEKPHDRKEGLRQIIAFEESMSKGGPPQ